MTPEQILNYLSLAVGIYGALCTLFNGLVALIAKVVKQTPNTSDDAVIEAMYNSQWYKTLAWLFSWGDYAAEYFLKRKNNS